MKLNGSGLANRFSDGNESHFVSPFLLRALVTWHGGWMDHGICVKQQLVIYSGPHGKSPEGSDRIFFEIFLGHTNEPFIDLECPSFVQ